VIICRIFDLPFRYSAYGESPAADASGFLVAVLELIVPWPEYSYFCLLAASSSLDLRQRFCVRHLLTACCAAHCGQDSLKHVEGLHSHLAGRGRVDGHIDNVTRRNRLPLPIDIDIDAFV
jgi:hypothetical protein